ncbi:MAG: hypothetical protein LUH15_18570 [Tannerellaceae bacterium]|nr:hypothetical protein [Tannerellaceae bacterium]
MKTYKIIWVDDEYQTDSIFENIIQNSNKKLSDCGVSLEVKYCVNLHGELLDDLDSGEYKLLITDIKIGDDKDAYTMLTKGAAKKRISYIIYSSHISKQKNQNILDSCVAVLEKNTDTSEIEKILLDFFQLPPFRILHLSDLHFDSSKKNGRWTFKDCYILKRDVERD